MAAGALAAAALGVVSATPANAAVMVSGSTIDAAGNYVDGTITVYTAAGAEVGSYDTQAGTFDIPLDDGAYKLGFTNSDDDFYEELTPEYYRDKPDLATADVVTVAGTAQTLAPWTIDRLPSVVGAVRTADGRVVRYGSVEVRDTSTGYAVAYGEIETSGNFRVATSAASVKVFVSGNDPSTGKPLAGEWFNDKATYAAADVVTPTAAGADIGTVALAPAGSISGRVTTEAGAPIQRAKACVTDYTCDYTDANGAYTIESVRTGENTVTFTDPIGEFVGERWNNVPLSSGTPANLVTVAPGQAVTGIDAALAAAPAAAPTGVDVSGTVRDELGNVGIGYEIRLWDTPADPKAAKPIASTFSNRAGAYHFSQLDRIPGETEFKIQVVGEGPREDGDFARRTTWSGDKHGYATAAAITAAPRTLDVNLPVAGGVSGAVTSEAGGRPDGAGVTFYGSGKERFGAADEVLADGSYDQRSLWAGTYTVRFSAVDHVAEWWKNATPDKAVTITVKPGQVVTGISAALGKEVKAVERPEVKGNAWVGKTVRLDKGAWNTEDSSRFTYEWLVGNTVVATGPSLKLTKSYRGKKVTGRVTNDAGFAQGQAITKTTAKVGYKPKVKATVAGKKIRLTIKAKPLKAKKTDATVVVYEVRGKRADGELKLKKIGKGKVKDGAGTATLKKPLGKGKHKLVLRIKGKGKVGSGDIMKKVKLKR
ncbi:hypothetical protein GCM10011376_01100 [Nocardioides flavus (ex Wang et al. 2016)]|uniref:Alpha-amylase n=1 Tax=Nocardioides flavus (ex Wang et al. 2016) TaxID=2058780 RepID=A0ABQ3HD49_9ACTN|nr:carboxypeptidase-like regulatory domain-containing protein [Nocardioides flavus (ex Wang et al. 2016)]GHE14990.1 hypothetical protein GCM10011376_01100 [Nocardioides flavus (ex Wang et al. 2016)]